MNQSDYQRVSDWLHGCSGKVVREITWTADQIVRSLTIWFTDGTYLRVDAEPSSDTGLQFHREAMTHES